MELIDYITNSPNQGNLVQTQRNEIKIEDNSIDAAGKTSTPLLGGSPKKIQLKINTITQKEENSPVLNSIKFNSNHSSPKKPSTLSPLLPPKNFHHLRNMIKPVATPKEMIKRNEDSFMLLNPTMKISTNTSFIKSSSLSPKKNKSHIQKLQSPMFLQDTQEFPVVSPETEIDNRGLFTRGSIYCI